MTGTIIIELAGEEEILVTRKKKEAHAEKRAERSDPSVGLSGVAYDELHNTMPEAYRALFEGHLKR